MPLIRYLCECHNSVSKMYRQAKDAPVSVVCTKCNKDMKRSMSAPSSASKIVIDNGSMARSIEISPDIIEVNKERSEKDYSQED